MAQIGGIFTEDMAKLKRWFLSKPTRSGLEMFGSFGFRTFGYSGLRVDIRTFGTADLWLDINLRLQGIRL